MSGWDAMRHPLADLGLSADLRDQSDAADQRRDAATTAALALEHPADQAAALAAIAHEWLDAVAELHSEHEAQTTERERDALTAAVMGRA